MYKVSYNNNKYKVINPSRKIRYIYNPKNKGYTYGVIPPSESKGERPLYYEGYHQTNSAGNAWKYGYLSQRLSASGPGNTWKNGVGEVIIYGKPVETNRENFGLGYGSGNEWVYNNPRNYNHSMGFKAYSQNNPLKYKPCYNSSQYYTSRNCPKKYKNCPINY